MRAIPAGDKTELVGVYMTEKTGCVYVPGMYQAMAILDDEDKFQGGVIFSEYRGYDCQISCASETPMAFRGSVCNAVFEYIFHQLGCKRCTSLTRKSNKRARGFLEALGFRLEGRIRKGFDGVKDALIYGLLAEECRFIQEFTGGDQQLQTASEAGYQLEAGADEEASTSPVTVPSPAAQQANGAVAEFW